MLARSAASVVVSLGFVLAFGCGSSQQPSPPITPESTLASAYCHQVFACACMSPGGRTFSDEADCVEQVTAGFDSDAKFAQMRGYKIDNACMKLRIDQFNAQGCELLEDILDKAKTDPKFCTVPCSVFHGDAKEGDECTLFGGSSECGQGLACVPTADPTKAKCGKACIPVDPNATIPLGQSCATAPFDCVPGAVCGNDGNCVPIPGQGQPCAAGNCDQGLYCDFNGTMTCLPTTPIGGACTGFECASGSYCMDSVCTTQPGSGYICAEPLRF